VPIDVVVMRAGRRSGLKLPAISLGFWQNFGVDRPLETSRSIVRRAFDVGVAHFDIYAGWASSVEQLEMNIASLQRLEFGRDELAEIDRYATERGFNFWARSSAE
jgi:L-glyceraldehyde 3-phosphate reductase